MARPFKSLNHRIMELHRIHSNDGSGEWIDVFQYIAELQQRIGGLERNNSIMSARMFGKWLAPRVCSYEMEQYVWHSLDRNNYDLTETWIGLMEFTDKQESAQR